MNGKTLFKQMAAGEIPARIPFVPTVYEHGARLINKAPAAVAQSEDLLVQAQLESYKLYGLDLISVGLDIYNVEYEALGGKVNYNVPLGQIPEPGAPLITCEEDLAALQLPDPLVAGRMPLFINAAKRIAAEIGHEVAVGGTIVGPFTLAAILRGFEDFIMDLLTEPEFAQAQLNFAAAVGLTYAKAFYDAGVGVAINESWIAPPLLSPTMYTQLVLPVEQKLIAHMQAYGMAAPALISGGDTTPIAASLAESGSSLLMADYPADRLCFKALCKQKNINLRASIESGAVAMGDSATMRQQVQQVLADCADYPRFILGCGVVSYDTDPQSILQLKAILQEETPQR